MNLHKFARSINKCALVATLVCTLISLEARAGMMAARVAVTGTLLDNSDTAAVTTVQTPGPALVVATNPKNLGDLTLLLGGSNMLQADGVIIAVSNQLQYGAVGNRNIIETPGELTATIPGGFQSSYWLSTTKVSGSGSEANFNLAMAHFPFAQGWVAGHVRGTDGTFRAGNNAGVTVTTQFDLPAAAFGTGHYNLSIAGVDSRVHGMLYAMSEENASSGNVVPVGILPDGSGWDIRINDQGGQFPATEQADWSYVYIPYNAGNLLAAGNIGIDDDASPVAIRRSIGAFTAERLDFGPPGSIIAPGGIPDGISDPGRFLIKISGKDDMTGYLMVGVSKYATASGNSGADDNFLTWQYSADLGGFVVETYDWTTAPLQNSDIYFAYFDYANPIIPTPEPGTACLAMLGLIALLGCRRRAAV